MFNSDTGYRANKRKAALAGVRIQRELGFPNLKWGRAVFEHNCRQRREWGLLSRKHARRLIRTGVFVGGQFERLSRRAGLKPASEDPTPTVLKVWATVRPDRFRPPAEEQRPAQAGRLKATSASSESVPSGRNRELRSLPSVRKSRPRPQYHPARWLPSPQGPKRWDE